MSLFSRHRISRAGAHDGEWRPGAGRPSLQQLQLVADSVPSLVAYVDANARFRFVNRAYEKWLNCKRVDVLGRQLHDVFGEGVWRVVEPQLSTALRGASVHFEAKLPFRERDGGPLWVDATFTPDFDGLRAVRGVFACFTDVTEHKEIEHGLLQNATREHEIAAALRESEARYRLLAEHLQAADRRKNEFLALLAHELRNPLAPIRNGLQLVRLAVDEVARERACAMMDRQLRHMVRLVDDLLDVSRITRSKLELRREPVELATVIRNAVEASGELIERFEHELFVELPEERVVLDADPVRMAQLYGDRKSVV